MKIIAALFIGRSPALLATFPVIAEFLSSETLSLTSALSPRLEIIGME